jgi:transportin-1
LRLVPILLNQSSPKSLTENAAVTIGRIGLVQPEAVAPHLESFAQAWCAALIDIKDNEEKDSAFRGFCTLIQTNPNGITRVSDL